MMRLKFLQFEADQYKTILSRNDVKVGTECPNFLSVLYFIVYFYMFCFYSLFMRSLWYFSLVTIRI